MHGFHLLKKITVVFICMHLGKYYNSLYLQLGLDFDEAIFEQDLNSSIYFPISHNQLPCLSLRKACPQHNASTTQVYYIYSIKIFFTRKLDIQLKLAHLLPLVSKTLSSCLQFVLEHTCINPRETILCLTYTSGLYLKKVSNFLLFSDHR